MGRLKVKKKLPYRIVSLFSGCGGSDLGVLGGFKYLNRKFKKLPTKIVFANDIDNAAVNTYRANFKHNILHKSIHEIASTDIPEHEILIAGFPCQPFSIVGM